MIGRTLGKYHIVDQLGRGATGIVYKAIDETLNREVAIKTLNPDRNWLPGSVRSGSRLKIG